MESTRIVYGILLYNGPLCPKLVGNWNNILDPDFKRSDEEKKVDSYFYQLAKSYSDTQFFKQAVHECKYFDYYVKNEF